MSDEIERNESRPDPLGKEAILILSFSYLKYQQYQKALPLLVGLNEVYPNDVQVLSLLAYAEAYSRHPENALITLDQLSSLGWQSKEYYLLRTQICQEVGDVQGARDAFQSYSQALQKESFAFHHTFDLEG